MPYLGTMLASVKNYIIAILAAAVVVLSIILWAKSGDGSDLEAALLNAAREKRALENRADSLLMVIATEEGLRSALKDRLDQYEQAEQTNTKKLNDIRNPRRRRITDADSLRAAILREVAGPAR